MDGERSSDPVESDRTVSTRRAPAPRGTDRADLDAEPRSGRLRATQTDRQAGDPQIVEPRAGMAEPTVPTNIYRARRPMVAIGLVVPAVAIGLLLVRAIAISAFGPTFLIGGLIGSTLALASLPLLVAGLYGLITGAAYGAEQWGFKVWARPPLAYLVVGIGFAVSAGLAVR